MTKAMKGALLSGLVFPGLGQVVLKRTVRGAALMLIVGASLYVVVDVATKVAFSAMDNMMAQGGMVDYEAASNAVAQSSSATQSMAFNIASFVILIGWIAGTIDAYLVGKRLDAAAASEMPASNERPK